MDDFGCIDMQTRHSESAKHLSLPHQFYTVLVPLNNNGDLEMPIEAEEEQADKKPETQRRPREKRPTLKVSALRRRSKAESGRHID